jgi:hypothetical protein
MLGFVNEHDWNIILYRVHETTRIADKTIAAIIQMNIALALRTRQNIEQLFADRHNSP